MDSNEQSVSDTRKWRFLGGFHGRTAMFHNLTKRKRSDTDYELMVYFCEGTDKEKLDWFKIINIAAKIDRPRATQCCLYWLMAFHAKLKFSKSN